MARAPLEVENDARGSSVARWRRGVDRGEKRTRALESLTSAKKQRIALMRALRKRSSADPGSVKNMR